MEQQDYFLVDLKVTHRFSCCSTERMCLLVVLLVPGEGPKKTPQRLPKDVKKAPPCGGAFLCVCWLLKWMEHTLQSQLAAFSYANTNTAAAATMAVPAASESSVAIWYVPAVKSPSASA